MRTDVQYGGIASRLSDYDCKDGEMSQLIDAVAEDGHIECVAEGSAAGIGGPGTSRYSQVYIHDTGGAGGRHVIALRPDGTVAWVETADGGGETVRDGLLTQPGDFTQLYQLGAMGNTLLALTDKGMYYFLWKDADGAYKHLGNHLPECDMKFDLFQTWRFRRQSFSVADTTDPVPADDTLAAAIETAVKEQNDLGFFVFPFFVRYCLHLATGEDTMFSAPVYMPVCPLRSQGAYPLDTGGTDGTGVLLCQSMLLAAFADSGQVARIRDDWKDIIKSLDIYVSPQLYTYNLSDGLPQGAKWIAMSALADGHTAASWDGASITVAAHSPYTTWDIGGAHTVEELSGREDARCVRLTVAGRHKRDGRRSDDFGDSAMYEKVTRNSSFFKYASVDFATADAESFTQWMRLTVKDTIGDIESREPMTSDTRPEDFDSHDLLVPTQCKLYNGCLQLTGVSKYHFGGFDVQTLYRPHVAAGAAEGPGAAAAVRILDDGFGDTVARAGSPARCGDASVFERLFHWYYYPNAGAYRADISFGGGYYRLPLKPHEFLAGAYWFGDLADCKVSPPPQSLPEATHTLVAKKDRMYVSVRDNPFVFRAGDIVSAGGGSNSDAEIIGQANVVEALSEGQFGEFPTYLFTGDGVRAAELDDDGKYKSLHPVSRDVCVWASGITEIDKAVLFPTARGIMQLQGSKTVCISDDIDAGAGTATAGLDDLPRGIVFTLIAGLHHKDRRPIAVVPFGEFVRRAEMAYDYVRQRIVVFNAEHAYAYVFDMKGKTWSVMSSDITGNVKSYPECLVQTGAGITDLSAEDTSRPLRSGVALTRPLKLGSPDTLKTLRCVIQRGVFAEGHVWQMVWGSNDLLHWHYVGSSKTRWLRAISSPRFKYFRIGLLLRLERGESLSGCSLEWLPKDDNRLR